MIGQTLSHYRITAALGAGGMGEVYRATDTNLERDVAIKVLPADVAQDPERLSRFRREAHLLASLNHPNIAAIYGLEEADGTPFLALELVEGEDLKQRLARGAIPIDDALEIAVQIAEALEQAHNRGIVHRDLKPANVKLAPDGKVKVLDFGLAKAWRGEASPGSSPSMLSQSPTVAYTGTVAGVILGTVAYMSPEQARGRPVDKRADVWAFGALLWEMLTGRILFSGGTTTDVIAAVVTEEPDLGALPAATPPAVRRLIARCLRKDVRARLPDIGAARLELQEVLAGTTMDAHAPGETGELIRITGRGRARERLAWAAAAIAAGGLAAALAVAFGRQDEAPESRPAARFAVDAPEGWAFATDFGWPVPSPDGRQIAFRAWPEDRPRDTRATMLWVRPLASLAARPLPGTQGATDGVAFWSPDGGSLAFFAGGELRRLRLSDGTVQRICAMPGPGNAGADWNADGTILFSAGGGTGRIYSVAAAGGEAKPLMHLDTSGGETNQHMPQFLADGRRFLFLLAAREDEAAGLYVASLDAPDKKRQIVPGWRRRAYTAEHLLFVRDNALLAQPFDAGRLEVAGEPVAIAASVATWPDNAGLSWFAASTSGGTLAYFSGQPVTGQVQLAWVDRKGGLVGTVGAPGHYGQVALSPDERNVALEIVDTDGRYDIWVMDVARGVTSRVTATPADDERDPVWSPDGRALAFVSRRGPDADLRRKSLRASDPVAVLLDSSDEDIPESWARDGRTLLFVRRALDDDQDRQSAWALPLGAHGDSAGKAEQVLSALRVDEPQLSPDGRWIAFVSRESGDDEVYLEPFRRDGLRVRVSVDGGGQPKWRADGRELFYTTLRGLLMAVAVTTDGEQPDVSLPTGLFEISGLQGTGLDDYAPSADGQRFLVKQPVEQPREPQLQIMTNWTSLLQ